MPAHSLYLSHCIQPLNLQRVAILYSNPRTVSEQWEDLFVYIVKSATMCGPYINLLSRGPAAAADPRPKAADTDDDGMFIGGQYFPLPREFFGRRSDGINSLHNRGV